MTTSNTSIVHLDPLELLQHGRELAERALNRLSLADQLRTVLAAPPSRREEVLVLSKDAAGLVAAMPIQEWWLTVVQIGAGESLSLIEMATSEQLQFALDVETWRKDRWQPAAILPWLCALFGCGSAKVLTWWRTADPDLLVLMLKRHVTVYMRSGDEEVMDAIAWPRPEPPQTFDNLYYFQCYDTEVERALRPCMDSLAHEDLPRLRHLFDAVLGAVAGEQEEAAYEVRERRLAEEGLPGWDEAIGVYARLRPAQWDGLKRSGPDRLHGAAVPQFGLRPLREQNLFLGEIVERLAPVAVDQLGLELARIANRVMIADGHAIAPMTVAAAARKALGYVNIGL
ncbi:MAG: hypothetical protein HY543_01045, partial [Deltaproteobacteria bacterium]|nr:hypothetical protein [Deltaproteobacteria bacterium]